MDLNRSNFDEMIKNESATVIVDFWASWCGPCRAQAPILDKLKAELGDKVQIHKVNVDAEEELAARFEIMTIPTLIIFKSGEKITRISGLQSLDALKRYVK